MREVTNIPSHLEYIGVFCTIPDRQQKAWNISSNATSKALIDAFAFVPEKIDRNPAHWLTPAEPNDDKLNLIVFGQDAVSHMNFIRIMPKVQKFLTQEWDAISMDGYVKIAGEQDKRCLEINDFLLDNKT